MGTAGRCLILAVACACASQVHASELQSGRCYASLDEAARAALAVALPLSEEVEHGGVVLAVKDQYCFSAPVRGTQDEVSYRVMIPAGVRLVALYHTHPSNAPIHKRRRFSDADLIASVRLGVPSYLGVAGTDDVRVFRDFNRAQYRAARWVR